MSAEGEEGILNEEQEEPFFPMDEDPTPDVTSIIKRHPKPTQQPLPDGHGTYSPEAVAACFLANIFARPAAANAIVMYWQMQTETLGLDALKPNAKQQLSLPSTPTATTAIVVKDQQDEDEFLDYYQEDMDAFRYGIRLFSGVPYGLEWIVQEKAVPQKTDKEARPFLMARFLFMTSLGPAALVIDDVFAQRADIHWTPGVDARPYLTSAGTMAIRPRDFFDVYSQHGMAGHGCYSRFKFAHLLKHDRLYRPSMFLLLQAHHILTATFLDALEVQEWSDEKIHSVMCSECRRVSDVLESAAPIPWHSLTPETEKEKIERLRAILKQCRLPRDFPAFWDHFCFFIRQEMNTVFEESYVVERDQRTGRHLLPGLLHYPTMPVPGEEVYVKLF